MSSDDFYSNPHIPSIDHAVERLKPFPTKVLIRVFEHPENMPGSAILRDTSTANYSASDRGVIIAKGVGVLSLIEPGDMVIYRWQSGDDFECNGQHLIFLEDADLYLNLGPESESSPW